MTNRKTRQNPLATARDLVDVTIIDVGDGEAQFVIGGIAGPTFTPTAAVWSGLTGLPAVIAAGDTKAEALEAVDIDTVFVEAFRDGIRTDNEIIEAAFDAAQPGGEVVFGQDVTYTLTTPVVVDLADLPSLTINGQGATLYGEAGVVNGPLFDPQGTAFASGDRPEVTADINQGDRELTVDDSSALQVGDLVSIYSDAEVFDSETNNGGQVKEEMARIAEVIDSTTVLLESRTWDSYSTDGYTVKLRHSRPMRNITVKDLTLLGDREASGQGMRLSEFVDVTLSNVRVEGFPRYGILGVSGFNMVGFGCRATRCSMEQLADYAGTVNGYGFWSILVHGVKWIGCYGVRNRHTVDAHRTRDLLIQGCTAQDDRAAGISTHGIDTVKVVDCTVRECGGGIRLRGTNNIVRGNHILGVIADADSGNQSTVNGIWIGAYGGQAGAAGHVGRNLVVEGNHIDITGPAYVASDSASFGIFLAGPADNTRIANNVLKGFARSAIGLRGNGNSHVEIVNNKMDVSGQQNIVDTPQNRPAILFNSLGAGSEIVNTDVVIADNIVTAGTPQSIVSILGGSTAGTVSDRISIRDNFAADCTVATADLSQYFGAEVEVLHRFTPSDQTVLNYDPAKFVAPPTVTDLTTATTGISTANTLGLRGANIASNPTMENVSFFADDGVYTTAQAYTGTRSIQLTGPGDVAFPLTCDSVAERPVVVQPGEVYYIELFVRGKSTNAQESGGAISVVARVQRTGTTPIFPLFSFDADTGLNSTWTKQSGYIIMPPDATLADFYVQVDDTVDAGEVYYFDNVAIYRCGDQLQVAVPATATSPGILGQWATDSSFYYRCTATDTWRRVAIGTW